MVFTYGTSSLGAYVEVREQSTTAVSLGFDADIAIVGGYDSANGSVASSDVGTAIEIDGEQEAEDLFGAGSELHRQVQLAFSNLARRVWAVPVPENSVTESFSSTSSGTLSNTPAFDPNVNTEHDITAQDTTDAVSATVNIVYDENPSTPSNADTINLNPVNGEWAADASSSYDITYDYGDYTTDAIPNAADTGARTVSVCTENEGLGDSLLTELTDNATYFTFQHGVTGAMPETTPSTYSDIHEHPRLVVTAPARGFHSASGDHVRTHGAVGGAFTSTPLTTSCTRYDLNGLDDLYTHYSWKQVQDFGDAEYTEDEILGVTPLIMEGGPMIVEDRTSSVGAEFRDLYKHEITDEIAHGLHIVADDFVSEPNTTESRRMELDVPIHDYLDDAASARPPLLATGDGSKPYTVDVSLGDTDDAVDVNVGIEPLSVAKSVKLDLSVGSVITYNGAETA